MQQRLSIVTLGVSNLKKSKQFYDSLGWKAANEGEKESNEIVAYNLNGMAFALYPIDKVADEFPSIIPPKLNGYSSFTMAYNVNSEKEVDEIINEAKSVGAEIVKLPEKVFWGGYSGYFSDPDGYLWEVAFNPFSKVNEDGSFQWSES